MSCINCFLSTNYQHSLKNFANQSGDRFENSLIIYKNLFLNELSKLKSPRRCNCTKHPALSKRLSPQLDWLECIQHAVLEESDSLSMIFDQMLYIYDLFINGKHYLATLFIYDLIERFDLKREVDYKELTIFYRGRKKSSSYNPKDIRSYLQIPFNQRYKVGNQRFSVSGIPITYLGSSTFNVLEELRQGSNNFRNLELASFFINPILTDTVNPKNNQLCNIPKIYDLTNYIFELVNHKLLPLFIYGSRIDCRDVKYRPNYLDIQKYIKLYLFTLICTFIRRDDSGVFIEEYVFAQILTESLKINNYDGIMFPSTRFYNLSIQDSAYWKDESYMNNLALFTNHDSIDNYDGNIFNIFEINHIKRRNHRVDLLDIRFNDKYNEVEDKFAKSNKKYKLDVMFRLQLIKSRYDLINRLRIKNKKYINYDFGNAELRTMILFLEYLKNFA